MNNSTVREIDKLVDAKLAAFAAKARQGAFAPAKELAAPTGVGGKYVTAKTKYDTNKVDQGTTYGLLKPNPLKPNTSHGIFVYVDSSGLFSLPLYAPHKTHWVDPDKNELNFESPAPV